MSIQMTPIGPDNLDDVVGLLQERNETIPAYTRWKYGQATDGRFRGVCATMDGKPVGCFGIVPRELRLPAGQTLPCGWFADWYVSPRLQGRGIGTALLRALSKGYPIIFGHPGSAAALAICEANGYQSVGFQSWRRLVLRPWVHERAQTRYAVKAAVRASIGLLTSP
jgi:GNAT superfamily N-acetyltransferase